MILVIMLSGIYHMNISLGGLSYFADVINEIPLTISSTFWSRNQLEKRTKEFHEAKKLLKKYGIY